MPKIDFSKRFRKDVKKWRKAGVKMESFEKFVDIVRHTWPPPAAYEPHLLMGTLEGTWDVHLRQNWVLLLQFDGTTIHFMRMGTHAELGL